MEGTYLSFEQVNALLDKKDQIVKKVERSLYQTESGELIPIANSKLYKSNLFWYSCVVDYFDEKGAKRICFVTGNLGILLIPMDILYKYTENCGWKEHLKGLSYYIRIKIRKDRYYLYNFEMRDIDVTQFFIPQK